MKIYKYHLDKSSKKFICPKCNKRTFVKYLETETNNYLNNDFGRCDRETNCGCHNTPKKESNNTFQIKHIAPIKPTFHNYNIVSQSLKSYKKNNFVQFLKSMFSEVEVEDAIRKYSIGTSKIWNGATVFWQIDNNQKVRHGKIMLYSSITGKRVKNKEGKAFISSARSVLKLDKFVLNQCLFGLHLINKTNPKTIAIVESEKTAIIMSIFKPEYIWLSTGSKSGFKYDMLKPIKDFKIVAFPDNSEYTDWLNKAIDLNTHGFKIFVNDWIENNAFKEGVDLADVLIDKKNTINSEIQKKPSTNYSDYTKTEQVIHKIEKHTPEIKMLIKTFDLTDCNGNEIRPIT